MKANKAVIFHNNNLELRNLAASRQNQEPTNTHQVTHQLQRLWSSVAQCILNVVGFLGFLSVVFVFSCCTNFKKYLRLSTAAQFNEKTI